MKTLKVLSLFDGISGARQALKELNIDCEYYASEIDKYAIQIAKANHPDIKDCLEVEHCLTMLKGHLNLNKGDNYNIDLMVGGFPCQSFSIAGNRKGLEDDRGQLFFDLFRILKEVKPKYFLFENVASMSKANQTFISEKLGVEPIKINSALLTAQQRKRLYWTNIPNVDQPEDRGIVLKDIIEDGFVDREKSHAIISSIGRTTHREYFKKNQGQVVFDKPVRIGDIGNRIYSQDGKSICLNANSGGLGSKTGLYEFKDGIRKLTITECERLQGFPDGYCSMVSKTQGYKALGNSFTVPVIKHILLNLIKTL
jgi:site-specific DNA-cytosine methylase